MRGLNPPNQEMLNSLFTSFEFMPGRENSQKARGKCAIDNSKDLGQKIWIRCNHYLLHCIISIKYDVSSLLTYKITTRDHWPCLVSTTLSGPCRVLPLATLQDKKWHVTCTHMYTHMHTHYVPRTECRVCIYNVEATVLLSMLAIYFQ